MNRIANYVLATALYAGTAQAAPLPSTNATTTYHRVQVDGVGIFYREAGPDERPQPSCSCMAFRRHRASLTRSFPYSRQNII